MPPETTDRARLSPTHNMYRFDAPIHWKQLSNSTPTACAAVFHLRMPPPYPISLRGDTHTVPHPGSLSLYLQV